MAWETVVPGSRANLTKYDLSISIQGSGAINWNKETHKKLGEPSAVKLLFDMENKLIAIAPASEDEANVFLVRPTYEGSKSVSIGSTGALRERNLVPPTAVRVPLEEKDGLFIGDVSKVLDAGS